MIVIAIALGMGILAAVFVVGGMYQQELFEEYVEDSQTSSKKDPINMDAYKTTEVKQLNLKPGEYRFGTFTFDFLFKVTLSGTLEYSPTLDQCVDGRGTQVLTIRCSHTQPYPQEPDYPK